MDNAQTQNPLELIVRIAGKSGVFAPDLPREVALALAQVMVDAGIVPNLLSPVLKCRIIPCASKNEERREGAVFHVHPSDPQAAERLEQAFSDLEDERGMLQGEEEFDIPAPDNADKVKPVQRIPRPKYSQGEKGNSGFGRHVYRGLFEPTDKPDYEKSKRHTWGDLLFYHAMKKAWQEDPDANPEWGWRRDLQLTNEVMNKLEPHEWLRSMLVLNGVSAVALQEVAHFRQTSWSNYVNGKIKIHEEKVELLLGTYLPQGFGAEVTRSKGILPGQLLGLPVIEVGEGRHPQVVPEIAARIWRKFGYNEHLRSVPPEFVLSLAAEMSGRYMRNEIPREDVEGMQKEVFRLLMNKANATPQNAARILRRMNEEKFHIPPQVFEPHLDALLKLPVYARYPCGIALPAQEAFDFACARAKDISSFLRHYRSASMLNCKDVVEKMGSLSKQRVLQLEDSVTQRFISDENITKILSPDNPYRLPVDQTGGIRADVQEYVRTLNAACKMKKRRNGATGYPKPNHASAPDSDESWLTIRQVLSEFLGMDAHLGVEGEIPGMYTRTQRAENPARVPYEIAWAALTAEAKFIAGEEGEHRKLHLRCGLDGELRVHENDALRLLRLLEQQRRGAEPASK